jgi:polar amino acid transport system substrate-binding protein
LEVSVSKTIRFVSLMMALWTAQAVAADRVMMVLATVGTATPGVTVVDGKVDEDRPGWFAELSTRAANDCGADLEFAFMPWARALELVKRGDMAAAFNSSYTKERAVYAVYPVKDGELDENRASKFYAYYAYLLKGSLDNSLLDEADVKGRRIVVERNSSIASTLEERGATVLEAASYINMLRMVAAGDRVDAAVGIEHNFDGAVAPYPEVASRILKSRKPVQKKVGYVMFSKVFYEQHGEMVECFWTKSAELKASEWFETVKMRYEGPEGS